MILLFGFATASLIIATLVILGETDHALAESMQTIELNLGLGFSIVDSPWGLSQFDILSDLVLTRMALLMCSNTVADIILIWRCYLLWGQRKKVIIVPALLCVATNVFPVVALIQASLNISSGIFARDMPNSQEFRNYAVFLLGALFTNLLLTVLLAARILYISRKVMKYTGKDVNKMYRTAFATTLESGLLYPVVLIPVSSIVLRELPWLTITSESTLLAIARDSLHQVVGIAPTLVIVRMSLGISIEDSSSQISMTDIQDEHDGAGVSSHGVIDISRDRNTESQAATDVEAQR
uniref:Uncharacterized protein n=1 Tax=Moniliophthora roreri TaxID=221103 RepID=A0A0W0G3R4_MONRR